MRINRSWTIDKMISLEYIKGDTNTAWRQSSMIDYRKRSRGNMEDRKEGFRVNIARRWQGLHVVMPQKKCCNLQLNF